MLATKPALPGWAVMTGGPTDAATAAWPMPPLAPWFAPTRPPDRGARRVTVLDDDFASRMLPVFRPTRPPTSTLPVTAPEAELNSVLLPSSAVPLSVPTL